MQQKFSKIYRKTHKSVCLALVQICAATSLKNYEELRAYLEFSVLLHKQSAGLKQKLAQNKLPVEKMQGKSCKCTQYTKCGHNTLKSPIKVFPNRETVFC